MDNSLELFGNKIAPRRILKTISGFEKKMQSAKNITGEGKNSPQLQTNKENDNNPEKVRRTRGGHDR